MRAALCGLLLGFAMPLAGQSPDRLDTLAALLRAEDRRLYDPEWFEPGLRSSDPVIRRQAALGAGRIQDHRALRPLLAVLDAPDTVGQAEAMFALGLLGDTTAVGAILARLARPDPLAAGAVREAPAALAKLGTPAARSAFQAILAGEPGPLGPERRRLMLPGLLVEGWRFGRAAPIEEAIPYLADADDQVRWRAAYLLGRTRASRGVPALLGSVTDRHPWVRQYAVRGLTRAASDSAGLDHATVTGALLRALRDRDSGVRVNALQSLATFGDSGHAGAILPLLRDPVPNVRLQAITALGTAGGETARAALTRLADDRRGAVVIRREALIGLLRRDTATVVLRAGQFARSADPALRLLATELAGAARAGDPASLGHLLWDPDVAVRAAALGALGAVHPSLGAQVDSMLPGLLEHPDRRLRGVAISHLARRPPNLEVTRELIAAWEREIARPEDAAGLLPLLSALRRAWEAGGEPGATVAQALFHASSRPADYLLRRAAQGWPELAEHWGAVWPAEVRYSDAEYRELARRYLTGGREARPRIRLSTAGRGTVTIELLGDQAPLTVANFLGLADQGYFDGGRWHRVIPNFVVQDGEGGPRAIHRVAPIRDEINPVRYDLPVLGMALSGPDTGTSQWFINLSPQPHLDGGYTVFGRVVGGEQALARILQGDHLSSVRR
jgi:cyclophilin family peptidyl-prolyl cis-trans isomerase/HEAT repeat protein